MSTPKKDIKEIKAISVIQPWADVIIHHGKNVENRQKNSHHRGYVAIYASKTKNPNGFDDPKSLYGIKVKKEDATYGSIIGFAKMVDVITKKEVTRKTQKFFEGKFGYVLEDIIKLKEPVKIEKGERGVWTLKGSEFKKCFKQLSQTNQNKILKSAA